VKYLKRRADRRYNIVLNHEQRPPTIFRLTATAPTHIYTLSLHDALPILNGRASFRSSNSAPTGSPCRSIGAASAAISVVPSRRLDRKSTRLNSSHRTSSYAVFCLKKKIKSHTCAVSSIYSFAPGVSKSSV